MAQGHRTPLVAAVIPTCCVFQAAGLSRHPTRASSGLLLPPCAGVSLSVWQAGPVRHGGALPTPHGFRALMVRGAEAGRVEPPDSGGSLGE